MFFVVFIAFFCNNMCTFAARFFDILEYNVYEAISNEKDFPYPITTDGNDERHGYSCQEGYLAYAYA